MKPYEENTTIVSSTNPNLYLATLITGIDCPDELFFTPIIAWEVSYFMNGKESLSHSGCPVPAGESVGYECSNAAIYDKSTDVWDLPYDRCGEGEADLLKALRANMEK